MPQRESHRTFAADPRDPQELDIHTTQQALREDFQLSLLIPEEGSSVLRQFVHSYELAHGHLPQPEDMPLWRTSSFPLPIDNIITPDTTQDFHNLMYSRMLPTHTRPIPPSPDTNSPNPAETPSTSMGNMPTSHQTAPPSPHTHTTYGTPHRPNAPRRNHRGHSPPGAITQQATSGQGQPGPK